MGWERDEKVVELVYTRSLWTYQQLALMIVEANLQIVSSPKSFLRNRAIPLQVIHPCQQGMSTKPEKICGLRTDGCDLDDLAGASSYRLTTFRPNSLYGIAPVHYRFAWPRVAGQFSPTTLQMVYVRQRLRTRPIECDYLIKASSRLGGARNRSS